MTELKSLDVLETAGTIDAPSEIAEPAKRPGLVANWELDPETGRPVCVWRVQQG